MKQRPLYKLRSTKVPDAVYQIEIWNEAYVVAVNLWTTNGSAAYVAKQTADYVKVGSYAVEDAHIEADFTDMEWIKAAILKVVHAHG